MGYTAVEVRTGPFLLTHFPLNINPLCYIAVYINEF